MRRYGGVSLQGRYHKKNQDRYFCGETGKARLLAVADGLGSRMDSEIGAGAFVQAAYAALDARGGWLMGEADFARYLAELHACWLSLLAKQRMTPEKASCTALLCIVRPREIYAARLGDGFIGICADGETQLLYDTKENRFANETCCLGNVMRLKDWQMLRLDIRKFEGALACTDGVTIDRNRQEKFVQSFFANYRAESPRNIQKELATELKKLKSQDDKTLAFLLPEGAGKKDGQRTRNS